MSNDYLVKMSNVKKKFGTKIVLNGLNLEIPRGKISFIIGRSGEGKSVTIKHIIGLIKPDSGQIWIEDMLMQQATQQDWEQARKKIGILFQDGALFDSLNVFENVAFPIENHLSLAMSSKLE